MPFDIVRIRWLWYALSLAFIIPGMIALGVRGLNMGTDFTGGAEITFSPAVALPADAGQRAALVSRISSTLGLGTSAVKVIDTGEGGQDLLIRVAATNQSDLDDQTKTVRKQLTDNFATELGDVQAAKDATFIGPTIGRELRSRALLMLVIGLGAILLYVRQRYNLRMAVGGIVALVHDVLVMLGLMALGHWEINSPFIAALLTVVGFSINDSVIIFDRIRENTQTRAARSDDLAATVNYALWQTMARSCNTTFTVIIVLVMLLLFGGATIREFTIALLIGMTSGAYSSIFNASQIVVSWHEWERRRRGTSTGRVRPGMPTPRIERRELEVAAAADGNGATGLEAADGLNASTKPRAQTAKRLRSTLKGGKSKKRH